MKKYLPFILLGAGLLMSFNSSITGLVSPASLDIKISKPPVVMPALYKVYANEDALEGKYSLFKMVITNNLKKHTQKRMMHFYTFQKWMLQKM